MVNTIIDYLQGMDDLAVAIRLVIATACGSLIGWERVVRRHSAGIRTFALVSLGSAVATVLNIYLALIPELNADVSRIPAGVVSGIGFLGAGTILVTGRNQIKGLTTAATLWVASCMGMAFGAGYLSVGFVCFGLVLIANLLLMHLSTRVEENSRYVSLYIEVEETNGIKKLRKSFMEMGYQITSMNKTKDKTLSGTDTALMIDLDFKKRHSHLKLIDDLNNLDFVSYVEEV
ncbi:putative Mg2+ transporter-C (MgtC) family protein [Pseudobutyrivibrio ruminis]|uniref:Putative Mg2+ transporter-C (MgtC) family protein n=1 Tax=Pseudobutyrivibrio ruminis TaxID=46206 RepID=A0A1H7F4C8_9FIRM|nr:MULTISPECIES: MgtC/SapB family protein [Pseudobutyrivibrio]MBE5913489.1 MgtC/SapB family protein [Pseudobutyrivibrio ruminis]SEK20951.1 putative Mg2+ transporter-C (MgtC) family protein [Pseudobutyrivibrio ruminis]SES95945.1 putative Mg2+ transporter-C (MgtC) family protein [Pseudobutyrivibrio sp. C4]SFO44204.1 putative Mg2+ transporter-C (MgtC) family protein [Pseudobutyrivibrio sp. JW11]